MKSAFALDWSRRTSKLKRLARTAPGDLSVDDVHDMRVITRRLRASLSILRHCTEIKGERKARDELRVLGRALGARRMLDIAIEDAKRYTIDATALHREHRRSVSALKRALTRKRLDSVMKQLSQVEKAIPQVPFERLSWRLQDFEWELAYLVEQRPRRPEARHQLRIQLKKVRYVIEALGRRSAQLQILQDHLGREHDLGVLQNLTGKNRIVARDERKARLRADRVMAPALRSAMKHVQVLRRDITP